MRGIVTENEGESSQKEAKFLKNTSCETILRKSLKTS